MSTSNINDEMRQAAEYAIRIARERFGKKLDYSESSLPTLEYLIEQAHQQFNTNNVEGKITNDTALNRTASVWGSYFGELIRGKFGGTWVIDDSKRLVVANGLRCSPIDYIYQRITDQLQVNANQYFEEVVKKLSSQPINSVQPEPTLPNSAYTTNQSQTQEPKVAHNTIAINKKLIWTIGIVGVIIVAIIFLINILGGTSEFKSNLKVFLAEGEKLNLMTGQGVNNADYRNQLVQVKSLYAMLGNSWPLSFRNDKVLFDKAITIWDLTLQVWDFQIKNSSEYAWALSPDLVSQCELYTGTVYSGTDDCISGLMTSASKDFEQGRANVNR
jgi:hypothetical protein